MNLNKYILFISVLFISCTDDTDEGSYLAPINPLDTQGNLLNGTWYLDPIVDKISIKEESPVTMDGKVVEVFNDMTLTISEGSLEGGIFSTLNNYDEKIWPEAGTWAFQDNDKNKILRSDGISLTILADLIHNYAQPKIYTLKISFTTTDGNEEVKWVFKFARQCSSPFNEGC